MSDALFSVPLLERQVEGFVKDNLFRFFGAYAMLRNMFSICFIPIK
jgi:hypothetical protein